MTTGLSIPINFIDLMIWPFISPSHYKFTKPEQISVGKVDRTNILCDFLCVLDIMSKKFNFTPGRA